LAWSNKKIDPESASRVCMHLFRVNFRKSFRIFSFVLGVFVDIFCKTVFKNKSHEF